MADVSKAHGDTQVSDIGRRPQGSLIGDCQGNQASAVSCDSLLCKEAYLYSLAVLFACAVQQATRIVIIPELAHICGLALCLELPNEVIRDPALNQHAKVSESRMADLLTAVREALVICSGVCPSEIPLH